ncbi:MAG: exodeoxyribonuclease VII large subunit [Myxococcales bacterium]|nr:exodeoxyribonuclease VII large subunit [Myxococcales bacterium]USN51721.1 MAG: exodeoxyribonuclease VII large subunit [Myxococcales bacterium]
MFIETVEEQKPLKVSELVALLKKDIEKQHRFVRVIGEISAWKIWRSGHCYFDFKDENALIPAIMFKPHFSRIPFDITDGMQVIISGRLNIYQANTRLQLIAEKMEPLGAGALALAYEQLKERLSQEGLFLAEHKKSVKLLNQCIGIVTSSHGAALRDMLRIIKNRLPKAHVLCAFAKVQGLGAKEEIASALKLLDESQECDVIIVGRGGGSLEDLWAFNEELVARAIFAAKTPVISAVGHETDTSISDLVADMRAATPTHAAQIVTPLLSDLQQNFTSALFQLHARQKAILTKYQLRLLNQQKRIKEPKTFLFRHWQLLDDLSQRLQKRAPHQLLRARQEQLHNLKNQLLSRNPRHKFEISHQKAAAMSEKLNEQIKKIVKNKRQSLQEKLVRLEALSPLNVLARGFTLIESNEGGVLTKASQTYHQQIINIRFQDGHRKARITME